MSLNDLGNDETIGEQIPSMGGFLTGVEVKKTPRDETEEKVNDFLQRNGFKKSDWKNYLESKNINNQLAGMGLNIEPSHRKVDEALELKKLETEFERYNTRKLRMYRSMDLRTP